jgi:hypothetical protein
VTHDRTFPSPLRRITKTIPGDRYFDVGTGCSGEGGDAGDVAADDERLDTVGSLVSADDLHVGQMAGHVVFEQEAVAAENVASMVASLFWTSWKPAIGWPNWCRSLA